MLARSTASLALLAFALAGCMGETKTSDADLEERMVDTPRLLELQRNKSKPAAVVDVRTADKFAEGHIPGAINIPYPELRAGDPRLARVQHVVVYGDGWTDLLVSAASKKLILAKYSNVHVYRGGVELWKSENRPLEQAAPAPAAP